MPRFINPDNNDFDLAAESDCIDAGTNFFVWKGDTIVNLSRDSYLGDSPDIGRYESVFQSVRTDWNASIPRELTSLVYPNPFNSTTTLKFSLEQPAHTSLTVFNLQGKEVKQLFEGLLPSGWHRMNFNAAGLSAGTYFVHLEAGGQQAVQKIMLMK